MDCDADMDILILAGVDTADVFSGELQSREPIEADSPKVELGIFVIKDGEAGTTSDGVETCPLVALPA